ncbi:LppX_LprAFG lipoprotein [Actinomadura sediminis]|uniref:LppX_LprAFG lipoprotein n=1 Tax=Actinomadura sediminis TaxID=1038904 RepID=A0ABW3EPH2_9ACTN
MNRRLMVAAGGTAMGAVLLLSGCGGDGSGGTAANVNLSANEALLASSKETSKADTFQADLTVTTEGDGAGKIRANGRFQLRPTLKFSAELDEASRGGSAIPGLQGRAIYTGDVLYAKVPQLARFVADGKPWVKIDVNQVAQQSGFDVRRLIDQVRKVNPAEQTKMLTGSEDVRRVGTEEVNGVQTTHYAGTVTVQDALSRLDAQTREEVRQYMPADADATIEFDLWTDGENLPRKLETNVKGDRGHAGEVTVVYSEYGEPVSVNPPPADQVGTLSLQSFLGGN